MMHRHSVRTGRWRKKLHLRHLLRRLGALEHAVLALDLGDRDAVIRENLGAARKLRQVMTVVLAPARHRGLVTPERDRDELAGRRNAAETLDRDEPVDLLERGFEACGKVEIVLLAARLGLNFENDNEHGRSPFTTETRGSTEKSLAQDQ